MSVIIDARFTSGLDGFSAGTHVTSVGSADINDADGALQIGAGQTSTIDFANIASGLSRFDFAYKVNDNSMVASNGTLIYALPNGTSALSGSSLATIALSRGDSSSSSVLNLTYRNTSGSFTSLPANGANFEIRRGDWWVRIGLVFDHSAKKFDIYIDDVLYVKGLAWPNASAAGFGRIAIVSQSSAPNTWFDSIKVQSDWSEGESILIDHSFVGGSGAIESSTPQTSLRQAHAQPWMIAPDTAYGGFTLGADGAAPVAGKKCFALQRCGANGILEAEFKTPASGTAYIGIAFRFWDYPSASGAGAGLFRLNGSGNTAALLIPDRAGNLQSAVSTAYTLSANTVYTLKLEMRGRVYIASVKAAGVDSGSYTALFTHTADTSAKGGRGMLIEELAGPFVDCTIGAATNYVQRFRFTGAAEASEQTRTIGLKYGISHGSIKEFYAPDALEPTRNIFWSRGIQYGHRSSADMCGSQQQAVLYDAANVFAVRQTGGNVTEYQHLGFGDCYVTLLKRGPWVSDGITVLNNTENFAPDWDLLPSHWDKGLRTITSTGASTLRSDATYHDWTVHQNFQALPAGHQSLTAFASGQQYAVSELVLNDAGLSGSIFDVTSKLEGSGDPISRAVSTSGSNLAVGNAYRVARAFLVQPAAALSDSAFVAWRDDLKTPATLSMATGTAKTDAAGDTNADGFNERHGWYEITCAGGAAEFTLPVASGARYMPVFRLNGWDSGATTITLGGSAAVLGTDYVLDAVASDVAVVQLLGVYTTDVVVGVASGGAVYTLTAEPASIAITGQSAALKASRKLAATPASIALSGQSAQIKVTRRLSAAPASIALAGQSAGLYARRSLLANPATITLTGHAVDLTLSSAPGPTYTLTVQAASLAYTGQAATLLATRRLSADPAAFSMAGQGAGLVRSYRLTAQPGVFAITGQDVALRATRLLSAQGTAFAFVGHSATLSYSGAPVGSAVWPLAGQVLAGVVYGPTGVEYTGSLVGGGGPTAIEIAVEVLTQLQATAIPVNLTQIKGQTIQGGGTEANPWGPG